MPTVPVHVRLDTELLAWLDEWAKAQGVNRSTALSRALERQRVAHPTTTTPPVARSECATGADPPPAGEVCYTPEPEVVAQSDRAEAAVAQPPAAEPGRANTARVVARTTRSSADDLRARLAETRERQASCPHPKVRRTGKFCSLCGGVVTSEPSGGPQ